MLKWIAKYSGILVPVTVLLVALGAHRLGLIALHGSPPLS